MSTHNIGFYGELTKIIFQLSSDTHPIYTYAISVSPFCMEPSLFTFERRCEKTGLRGFRPGPTQTGLYSHRRWLEA